MIKEERGAKSRKTKKSISTKLGNLSDRRGAFEEKDSRKLRCNVMSTDAGAAPVQNAGKGEEDEQE